VRFNTPDESKVEPPALSIPITLKLCSTVVVPVVPPKKALPATESLLDGVVVPIPNHPLEFMVRAEFVDVANVLGDEVAI
jgi:hypothetical protein